QKNILQRVLCISGISKHSQSQRIERTTKPIVERAEGALVSATDPLDNFAVCNLCCFLRHVQVSSGPSLPNALTSDRARARELGVRRTVPNEPRNGSRGGIICRGGLSLCWTNCLGHTMNHRVRMQRFVTRTLDIRGNRGSNLCLPRSMPCRAVPLVNVDLSRGSHSARNASADRSAL